MKKKKSYNPFKMWGSYVGAIIGIIIEVIQILNTIKLPFLEGSNLVYYNFWDALSKFYAGELLWLMVIGFLIGWGIHSLIRALRRK